MQCTVSYPPPFYNILILLKYVVWLPISIQCFPEDIGNVEKSICRVIDRKQARLYRVHMMHYAPRITWCKSRLIHVWQKLDKQDRRGEGDYTGKLAWWHKCSLSKSVPFRVHIVRHREEKEKGNRFFLSHFQKVAWLQALFDAHDTLCLDIVTQNCRVTKKGNWGLSVPAETKGKLCRSWNILL